MPILLGGTAHAPPGIARVYAGSTLVYQAGSGGGGSGPYQPNANGNLVFEARGYDSNTPGPTHSWDEIAGGGYTGGVAMQALPNNDTTYSDGHADAPVMRYEINVPATGTWLVYTKGEAPGGEADNNCWVRSGGGSWANVRVATNYGWLSTQSLSLSAGVQTFEIQMREDGLILDRIILCQSAPANLDAEPDSERS